MNSGNTEAFLNYQKIYDCFVKIVGDKNMRQDMVEIVSLDDGSGKYVENNRREHGGYILGGKVHPVESGDVDAGEIKIKITGERQEDLYVPTFHSHPSGTDSDNKSFEQYPSDKDIKNAEGSISYVFGRSNGIVYIYDGNGVLSKMPYKWFVRFR